mgnify:CR=1 FL=1
MNSDLKKMLDGHIQNHPGICLGEIRSEGLFPVHRTDQRQVRYQGKRKLLYR